MSQWFASFVINFPTKFFKVIYFEFSHVFAIKHVVRALNHTFLILSFSGDR